MVCRLQGGVRGISGRRGRLPLLLALLRGRDVFGLPMLIFALVLRTPARHGRISAASASAGIQAQRGNGASETETARRETAGALSTVP
jgi:hypothetical protein